MSNVTDLSLQFALSKPAASLLRRAQIVGEHAEALQAILATLEHTEQRFLAAMIAWRIEGGQAFPASDLLTKLPSLYGLEFGSICATAEKLSDAGVIEVVVVERDAKQNPIAMAFVWPALERFLTEGERTHGRPRLTDLQGQPLR